MTLRAESSWRLLREAWLVIVKLRDAKLFDQGDKRQVTTFAKLLFPHIYPIEGVFWFRPRQLLFYVPAIVGRCESRSLT